MQKGETKLQIFPPITFQLPSDPTAAQLLAARFDTDRDETQVISRRHTLSSAHVIEREEGADARESAEQTGLRTASHRNVSTFSRNLAQADQFCLPERSADDGLELDSQHIFPPLSQSIGPAPSASAASTGRRASWAQVAGLTSTKNTYESSDADTVSTTITSGCSMSVESSKISPDLMAGPGDKNDFHPYLTTKSHGRAACKSPRKIIPEEWIRTLQTGEPKKKASPAKATRAHGPILATAQRAAAREEHQKIAPSTRDSCNKVKSTRKQILSLGEDAIQPPVAPTRIPRLRLKMNFQRGAQSKIGMCADEDAPPDEVDGSVPPSFAGSFALSRDEGEPSTDAQQAVDVYKSSLGRRTLDQGVVNAERYEHTQGCQDCSSADHSASNAEITCSPTVGSTIAFTSAIMDNRGVTMPSTSTNNYGAELDELDELTSCDEFSTESESNVPVGVQWAVHYGHDLAKQGNIERPESTHAIESHPAQLSQHRSTGQPQTDRLRQTWNLDGHSEDLTSGPGTLSSSKVPFNAEAREFVPLALSKQVPFSWQMDQYSSTKREKYSSQIEVTGAANRLQRYEADE
ncbi:hypothetical protein K490DRAFT_54429 [Saccharata proteae CBS 121410]|uniref:Uncharacterized protein n=1 Tax=Saccharata proteae CBS 121410 TaxID=1314787 RepID=A0A9P4M1K6_9PEZI|nr:hypothetical protein K490DRAFT_54429 [Saccharata proteae CBS 121410]